MSQRKWLKLGERILVFLLCLTIVLGSSGMYALAEGLDSQKGNETENSLEDILPDESGLADIPDQENDREEIPEMENLEDFENGLDEVNRAIPMENWHEEYGYKWKIDGDGLLTIEDGEGAALDYNRTPGWCGYVKYIKRAEVKTSNKIVCMSNWFAGCVNLVSVDFSKADLSNINGFYCMFNDCKSLETVNFGDNHAENAKDMFNMFYRCTSLKTVDLSSLDTSNVTNVDQMFDDCTSLESVDLSGMFNVNFGKVERTFAMFRNCSSLKEIKGVSELDTSSLTNAYCMFSSCSSLKTLDVSKYDTSEIKDMTCMFYQCSGLTSLDLSSFNTEQATNMSSMFSGCTNLEEIKGIEKWNTSNVASMSSMFENCKSLKSLDLSNFDTSKATDIGGMFKGCASLETLNISKFVFTQNESDCLANLNLKTLIAPPNVTFDVAIPKMKDQDENTYDVLPKEKETSIELVSYEVQGDPDKVVDSGSKNGLEWTKYENGLLVISGTQEPENPVDYNAWGKDFTSVKVTAEGVTSTGWWFNGCSKLTSIDFSEFDASSVTVMTCMYKGCTGLVNLDLSGLDTSKVTNMGEMFNGCTKLESVTFGGKFSTENVTAMYDMFSDCTSLKSLDLSSFDTAKVEDIRQIFNMCQSLESITFSENFKTTNITSLSRMFNNCRSLKSIDVSSFDTSKVEYMTYMFCGCYNLTEIKGLEKLRTDSARYLDGMFADCKSLKSINLSNFNTQNATDINSMFSGCPSIESLDLSSFDTAKVENMSYMFQSCPNLREIKWSDQFVTNNVTNMSSMFSNCYKLESLDLKQFKTDKVTDMYFMFDLCYNLDNLDLSGFNTDKVTRIDNMFNGCTSFTELDLSGMDFSAVTSTSYNFISRCFGLEKLKTPKKWIFEDVSLSRKMYDSKGTVYEKLPKADSSITLTKEIPESKEEEKIYTVSFDLQEHGTAIDPVKVKEGEKATAPTAPTAEGYTFGGWYKEAACTTEWKFDTDTVTADVTLYAKWTENEKQEEPKDPEEPEKPENNGNTVSPVDKEESAFDKAERKDLKSINAAIGTVKAKVYDGNPYLPTVKVTGTIDGKNTTLIEGIDYRVLFENNVNANDGKGKVIVKGNGMYQGTVETALTITKKPASKLKAIAGGMAQGSTEKAPVYVYDGSKLLTEGTDYTLSGTKDLASSAGKKDVTITMKGNYEGALTAKVEVYETEAKVLKDADVTLEKITYDYTGKAQKPSITVKYNGETLDKSCYKVKYVNNKEAGTAYVTVTGKKGYTGSVVKTFTIKTVSKTFEVKEIKAVTYNGKYQKPKAVISVEGKKLKAGKDYILLYSNNLHAGQATVTVKGLGNYKGTPDKEAPFTINSQNVKKISVKGTKEADITYLKRALKAGTDYTITVGAESKGKVPVTIEGKGDFTGSVTKKVMAQ